jgi:DNA-binding IclR family transcriptional regulator
MAARTKNRLGIQSVEVAARILRALAQAGRSLPLKDLARAAGMHPGKAHRYLVSLTRVELVIQDETSGHYGIGPAAIAWRRRRADSDIDAS